MTIYFKVGDNVRYFNYLNGEISNHVILEIIDNSFHLNKKIYKLSDLDYIVTDYNLTLKQ